MLELNRKQELQLIKIGLETLLSRIDPVPAPVMYVPKSKVPLHKEIKRKYRMSASARKAVSDRMVKYWAKRRKTNKK